MPTTTIDRGQSFSDSVDYTTGNGTDAAAQASIDLLPATPQEGMIAGFEKGKRARVISTNLAGSSKKNYVKQFNKNARRRSDIKEPVLKITINLKPGERLKAFKLVEMVNHLRHYMGLENCPFLAVEHREKPHQHLHNTFSIVDFDGVLVSNKFDRLKVREWARLMETKYNLTPTPQRAKRRGMTSAETERRERTGELPEHVQLQNHIDAALHASAPKFVERLEEKNINVMFRFEKGKAVGISFLFAEKKYAGGRLGTDFTWGELQRRGVEYNPLRDDEKLAAAGVRAAAKSVSQSDARDGAKEQPEPAKNNIPTKVETEQKYESPIEIFHPKLNEKLSETTILKSVEPDYKTNSKSAEDFASQVLSFESNVVQESDESFVADLSSNIADLRNFGANLKDDLSEATQKENEFSDEDISVQTEAIKQPTLAVIPTLPVKDAAGTERVTEPDVLVIQTSLENEAFLIEEVLQMSFDTVVKLNDPLPDYEAFERFRDDLVKNAASQKATVEFETYLQFLQSDIPEKDRVSAIGKSRLEATHVILKLADESSRKTIIENTLESYATSQQEDVVDTEPVRVSAAVTAKEFKREAEKTPSAQNKLSAPAFVERSVPREISTEQVISPSLVASKQFEDTDINSLPYAEPVKNVAPELTDDIIIKPEVIELEQQSKLPETTARIESKPAVRIRDFDTVVREKLISELVAVASAEAESWTGEKLNYRVGKRLTKMYRQLGDGKPTEKQIKDLNILQKRFDSPLPQPRTVFEAAVIIFDNMTDAEKSALMRKQITVIDATIKREESLNTQSVNENFWNVQTYSARDPIRQQQREESEFMVQMAEAQSRSLIPPQAGYEVIKKTIEEMHKSDLLINQIKQSLDEQGIKLEQLAQTLVNSTVDSYIKQQPTPEESLKIQQISQNMGIALNPVNKLEAAIYISSHDERECDKISFALAAAATEKADKIKEEQIQTKAKTKSVEMPFEQDSFGYRI